MRRGLALIVVLWLMPTLACTEGEVSADEFCRRLAGPLPGTRWVDVDFVVFIDPAADDRDVEAIRDALDVSDGLDGYTWVDQDEAYADFVELFADSPEMIEAVSPEILPASAHVRIDDQEPEAVRRIGVQFESRRGVYRVVYAGEFPLSVIEGSVRPLTSAFATGLSLFSRSRTDIRLAEVAPSSMRDHVDVLESFWAAPAAAGERDGDRIAEAASAVAEFYDTNCV